MSSVMLSIAVYFKFVVVLVNVGQKSAGAKGEGGGRGEGWEGLIFYLWRQGFG